MTLFRISLASCLAILLCLPVCAQDKPKSRAAAQLGTYEYEPKSSEPELISYNPAKAPAPGPLYLQPGDRLAIVGDSITEQKMYSRIIENYLTMCVPDLKVTVRQYGWSGEKTDGFLRRMEQDCLRFDPTIATICYGMNDARYRPFDVTNGRWYRDHLNAIVERFQKENVRVVVGSPGCSGKIASWVANRSGTLEEHNQNLCALRDIALAVSQDKNVPFADIFWPMLQARVAAPKRLSKSSEEYAVAGKDGIHPGWAGQVIMAYAFLRALGLDGDLGTIQLDLATQKATASAGHKIESVSKNEIEITSNRYPFCANGALDDDNSIRSGMTLVPFSQHLNRLTLRVQSTTSPKIRVTWGATSRTYTADQASEGINIADDFIENPFSAPFERVNSAVLAKQTFETHQIKKVFHGEQGKKDLEEAVRETEAERAKLAKAIVDAFQPVKHVLRVEPVAD